MKGSHLLPLTFGLNPNSAVEIFTEAKVARSVEHQMATEG